MVEATEAAAVEAAETEAPWKFICNLPLAAIAARIIGMEDSPDRGRYLRIAKHSALTAAVALTVAVASFLLIHGPLRQLGGALIAVAVVIALGAQAVFFWAFFVGRLYK